MISSREGNLSRMISLLPSPTIDGDELEWLTNPVLSTPIRYAHGD